MFFCKMKLPKHLTICISCYAFSKYYYNLNYDIEKGKNRYLDNGFYFYHNKEYHGNALK